MRLALASLLLLACGKTTTAVDAGPPPPPPPPPVDSSPPPLDTSPRKVTLVPLQTAVGQPISILVRAGTTAPLPEPITVEVTLALPNGTKRSVTTSMHQDKVCMPIDPVTEEDLKKGPYCQPGPIRDGDAFFPGPAVAGHYVATATGKPPIDVAPLTFDIAGAANKGDR